jgi:hypothetical protein
MLEGRALPSTLTVLTNADDGQGSLRAVIAEAQNGDQIIFDHSMKGQTITLTSGELAITKDLDIEGPGADQLAVSGNHASRIFDISGGVAVTIAGLTITAGMVAPGTIDALGGGIFNNGDDLTLNDVVLQNNVARGGDWNYSHIDGYSARGGGLYSTGGAVTIADSTIAGNQATGGNGVIRNPAGNGGDVAGGGIYTTGGSLTIEDSTIASNRAIGGRGGDAPCGHRSCSSSVGGQGGVSQGGGLYFSGGMLTIADSTVAGNILHGGAGGSGSFPGQGGVSQGGGLYLSGGMLTVADSTIAGNTLQGGDGTVLDGGWGQGGGLYISGMQTTLTVSNATIAFNSARGGDGGYGYYRGGAGQGGGLWVGAGASTQVSFSTIATNQAIGGSSLHAGMATGGGVYNQGLLQTRDTLLVRNMVNGPGTNSGPDLAGDLGSLGHNLIGNSQGGSGFDATDLLDVDPLLGPLQDNGGPTETMALLPGSPAIGAGDKTGHPRWDQRGRPYHRVVNHRLDIGAFEVQSADPDPSAPANGRGEEPLLTALISGLALLTDRPAIWSAAPFPGSATAPSLNRDVVSKREASSELKTVAVDQVFASFERDARGPTLTRGRDREPIPAIGSNPGFLIETTGLIW